MLQALHANKKEKWNSASYIHVEQLPQLLQILTCYVSFCCFLCSCSAAYWLVGQQRVSKFKESARNEINIHMVLYRLPQFTTDILITFNDPVNVRWGPSFSMLVSSSSPRFTDTTPGIKYFEMKCVTNLHWMLYGGLSCSSFPWPDADVLLLIYRACILGKVSCYLISIKQLTALLRMMHSTVWFACIPFWVVTHWRTKSLWPVTHWLKCFSQFISAGISQGFQNWQSIGEKDNLWAVIFLLPYFK